MGVCLVCCYVVPEQTDPPEPLEHSTAQHRSIPDWACRCLAGLTAGASTFAVLPRPGRHWLIMIHPSSSHSPLDKPSGLLRLMPCHRIRVERLGYSHQDRIIHCNIATRRASSKKGARGKAQIRNWTLASNQGLLHFTLHLFSPSSRDRDLRS